MHLGVMESGLIDLNVNCFGVDSPFLSERKGESDCLFILRDGFFFICNRLRIAFHAFNWNEVAPSDKAIL